MPLDIFDFLIFRNDPYVYLHGPINFKIATFFCKAIGPNFFVSFWGPVIIVKVIKNSKLLS